MNTRTFSLVTAALLFATAAGAQTAGSKPSTSPGSTAAPPNMTSASGREKLSMSESGFLKHAAQGGMAEVTLATTAENKSSNADVKALAEKIKSDHEKANQELQTVASTKSLTLPAAPSTTEKATEKRLNGLSGVAFDRAYVNAMVKDHRADVKEFQKYSKDKDPDVARFASQTLPVLQDHLSRAEALQKTLNPSKTSSRKTKTPASASQARPTTPSHPSSNSGQ